MSSEFTNMKSVNNEAQVYYYFLHFTDGESLKKGKGKGNRRRGRGREESKRFVRLFFFPEGTLMFKIRKSFLILILPLTEISSLFFSCLPNAKTEKVCNLCVYVST